MGKSLFDEGDNVDLSIKTDEKFMQDFNERKKKEELSRAKNMDLDAELDDSSSSSEEEDDGTTEPKEWQDQFLKVIPLLAKKDASLKDSNEKIFPDKEIDKTKKEKEEKPFTLKDYVRGRALEAMKNGEEGDVFGSDDEMTGDLAPADEQRKLKKDFLKATGNLDDDDDLFQLKVKDKADKEKEEKDFQEWKELHPDEAKKMGMKHLDVGTDTLSSFWASNNENLSQDEKFLRRYIWDKLWLEKDNDGKYDEIDEQEDAVLDKQDNYERKYNFRFEEEGGTEITHYPRKIEDSLRRKDNSRAEKRKARQERKEEEKKKKQEEIKRLKNLKKEDIRKRLEQIKESTGVDVVNEKLENELMEDDFDPEKFDKTMQAAFDDDYYNGPADAEKPVFEDDPYLDNIIEKVNEEQGGEGWDGAGDVAEEDEEGKPMSKKERRAQAREKAKQEKLAAAATAKEDASGEADGKEKDLADKLLEEYYGLDFEDVIAGMPTRFHYVSVPADSYGMTTDEILNSDDKALNKKVSLKKLRPYRDESDNKRDRVAKWNAIKKEREKRGLQKGFSGNGSFQGKHQNKQNQTKKMNQVKKTGKGQKTTKGSQQ